MPKHGLSYHAPPAPAKRLENDPHVERRRKKAISYNGQSANGKKVKWLETGPSSPPKGKSCNG